MGNLPGDIPVRFSRHPSVFWQHCKSATAEQLCGRAREVSNRQNAVQGATTRVMDHPQLGTPSRSFCACLLAALLQQLLSSCAVERERSEQAECGWFREHHHHPCHGPPVGYGRTVWVLVEKEASTCECYPPAKDQREPPPEVQRTRPLPTFRSPAATDRRDPNANGAPATRGTSPQKTPLSLIFRKNTPKHTKTTKNQT